MACFVVLFGVVLWPMLRLLGGWFHGLVVIILVDCFRPDLGNDFRGGFRIVLRLVYG